MPDLPFPITADDLPMLKEQIRRLMLEIFEERIGGAHLGDVFSVGDDDVFTLDLASVGGLKKTASTLSTKVKTDGGIDVDEDGLYTASGMGGFPTSTELTISAGAVTVSGVQKFRFHNIDTEGDAASDDLDTVSGGNAGELLLLQAEDSTRTVVCKDGTSLKLQADFSLNNTEDKLLLICISSGVWHEISRSSNGG